MSSNQHDKLDKHLVDGSAAQVLATRAAYNFGSDGAGPLFYRFVVLEVIFDPTTVDDKKRDYFRNTLKVSNYKLANVLPRNAIVARQVLDGKASHSSPALLLFPFFPPPLQFPVQAGEHVWAMFEHPTGKHNDIGYWFCRIVEAGFVDDVNHTHEPRILEPSFNPGTADMAEGTTDAVYEFRNGRPVDRDGERYSAAETLTLDGDADAYEKLMTDSEAGKLMGYEAVPRYRKRPGEFALEGTNNSLIVLGRDRTGAVAKFKDGSDNGAQVVDTLPDDDTPLDKKGAGQIDMVVGRGQTDATAGKVAKSKTSINPADFQEELGKSKKELVAGEGDPDFKNDRSRILLSQRTKPDKNFKIDSVVIGHAKAPDGAIKDADDGGGAIVIKTDKVRLIARQDLVILVTGAKDSDKDANGNIKDPDPDPSKCASVIIRANGDIVFTPATAGTVKLGGDDANLAVLCVVAPNAASPGGAVVGAPITNNFGGVNGAGGGSGQWATKILVK